MNTNPVKIWRDNGKRYRYLGKVGRVFSVTRVVETPKGFGVLPYLVGIIGINGGKTTGQIVGDELKVKRGVRVVGVLRRIREGGRSGVIEYGVKFKVI